MVNTLSIDTLSKLLPVQIDSEFQQLIPPPQSSELSQLETNISEVGCLEPLIIWRQTGILLDGHNRYAICQKLQIPYAVVEIDLPSRDAALAWIANHQLGRRNVTPEVASYLRGKCYLHSKGNRNGNLKQNQPNGKNFLSVEEEHQDSPNGKIFLSVDVAKQLGQQYKVTDRTIRNDALFAGAIDTISDTLGSNIKKDIFLRNARLTKKEILSLAVTARKEGVAVARTVLNNKLNKTDIVQQIINKQRVPNPHYKGQVCQIIAFRAPELKKFANCWCIINQVNEHTCNITTWREDIPTVKPENLKPLECADEEGAARNHKRIRQLADKVFIDYEPMHVAAVEALAFLKDPSQLTPRQERLLQFLEKEYNL
ncbi:hypothetical protein RIVM261_076710 [Rivularia sp. IAM M-261]|nr:hypothetical protein RIVM261_076710 [Rivularia sp. IAM M-261]